MHQLDNSSRIIISMSSFDLLVNFLSCTFLRCARYFLYYTS